MEGRREKKQRWAAEEAQFPGSTRHPWILKLYFFFLLKLTWVFSATFNQKEQTSTASLSVRGTCLSKTSQPVLSRVELVTSERGLTAVQVLRLEWRSKTPLGLRG